jgi:hypothetical protein
MIQLAIHVSATLDSPYKPADSPKPIYAHLPKVSLGCEKQIRQNDKCYWLAKNGFGKMTNVIGLRKTDSAK